MPRYWKVILGLCLALLLTLSASMIYAQGTTNEPETTEEVPVEVAPTEEVTPNQAETSPPEVATAQPVLQPVVEGTTYTVQAGDNLYRIALRFGTTTSALAAENNIANASQIFVGQVLKIPASSSTDTPEVDTPAQQQPLTTPEPTPPPPSREMATYTVQRGDTLYRIALQFNTTIADLVAANNLANPSVIYVGQILTIPGAAPAPETSPEDTAPGDAQSDATARLDADFAYGIEVFFGGQDMNTLVNQVNQLGMSWVKVRVDWRALESEQGQIGFGDLDRIVDTLDTSNLNILFTVTNAPTWARISLDENGPPDDLATFQAFIEPLASRYAGRVDAYEIWDEPNLRRNWNCERRMCDTDYLELLRIAYRAIKSADSDAVVLSAGLAPTRFNDRVNAIDDRLYLETLYANGLADITDAIGAHPGGWANPPDAVCCDQPSGVETHYESDSFYFKENLSTYREIMVRSGDADTPIWITKFGWGTSEDTDAPGEINVFVTYTSLAEQALYVPRAFELGDELGYIGLMVLDNLNGCQGLPSRAEVCYTALISPNGTPRLVFNAVQAVEKTANDETIQEETSLIEPVPLEPVPETTEEASGS